MIAFQGLTVALGGCRVLEGVSGTFPRGTLTALLGPNGSGKTTLLRALAGAVRLQAGSVTLLGQEARYLSPAQRARLVALLPQENRLPGAMTVWELLALARLPYRSFWQGLSRTDREAMAGAALAAGAQELLWRPLGALSGGERARALFAMALAQETPALLLDEPSAALDPRHSLALMEELRRRCGDGLAAAVSVHDVNLASWAHRFLALQGGRVIAQGTMEELDGDLLERLYGVAFRPYWGEGGRRLWAPWSGS